MFEGHVRRQALDEVLPAEVVKKPAGHAVHDWLPGLLLYVLIGQAGIGTQRKTKRRIERVRIGERVHQGGSVRL